MPSILTTIESNMATLIGSMRIANGYNYDWGTVNQPDPALCDFPRAMVYVSDEVGNDDPEGAWAGAYWNDATFTIAIDAPIDVITSVPEVSANAKLNDALDDLKSLFGSNPSLSDAGNLPVLYKGSTREMYRNGDWFLPKHLLTTWSLRYIQDRSNPSQIG